MTHDPTVLLSVLRQLSGSQAVALGQYLLKLMTKYSGEPLLMCRCGVLSAPVPDGVACSSCNASIHINHACMLYLHIQFSFSTAWVQHCTRSTCCLHYSSFHSCLETCVQQQAPPPYPPPFPLSPNLLPAFYSLVPTAACQLGACFAIDLWDAIQRRVLLAAWWVQEGLSALTAYFL